ncbi:MAG: two-component system sensor histidine kinase NtrB [Planctomycetota bacterium]
MTETHRAERHPGNKSSTGASDRDVPGRRFGGRVVLGVGVAALGSGFWLVAAVLPNAETLAQMGVLVAVAAASSGLGAGLIIGWIVRGGAGRAPRAPTAAGAGAEPGGDEKLFGYIIDSMEGGVMTTCARGTVTSFNSVAEETLGCRAADVVGRHFSAVFPDVPGNEEIREMIRSALSRRQTFSSVEVSAAAVDGGPVSLGATISPLRGEDGRHQGLVILFKNLAELKQLRERVERTDQLASLGRLSAGMAHEIRNPLGSLRGLVELIGEDFGPDDPKRRYIDIILSTIDQLNNLVENLLQFSQPPTGTAAPYEVCGILRESVELSRPDPDEKQVEVEHEEPGQAIRVNADRERLARAVINVVRNAFEATPAGGTVRTSVRLLPGETRAGADRVDVAVHNTGSYISSEDRGKLFTPFFTTRPQGTGLGLAIAHQIVSAHDGAIEVESEPETGTTFHIILPVESAGAGAAPQQETQGATA